MRAAGRAREDYFLTTKVWHDRLDPERCCAPARTASTGSGLEQVDLFLIHWPNAHVPLKEQMEGC
ncbi:MAG: aldo/keto reductase [Alphaproteobacteria bacterium]|nr:aldo/keto reductase [Alphaproteobacteria bacterium]